MSGGALHDGWSKDGFVGTDIPGGTVRGGRNGRDWRARRESAGEQFPARGIGVRGARGTSDDERCSGRKTKRCSTARESCADAGKFFGGNQGSNQEQCETFAGVCGSDENSRRNVARSRDSAQ